MLQLLLLAVHALPAYVPYGADKVVPIDYQDGRLAVGDRDEYIGRVVEAARWEGLTSVNLPLPGERHVITGWRAGRSGHGLYVSHTTDGNLYKTYLPGIINLSNPDAITTEINRLVGMYADIIKSPGMKTGEILDFVVPKPVQDLLQTDNPTLPEIVTALPFLPLTMQALEETAQAQASYSNKTLDSKHLREADDLSERLEKRRTGLTEQHKLQQEAFNEGMNNLEARHQKELEELEELQLKNIWRETASSIDKERLRQRAEITKHETPGTKDSAITRQLAALELRFKTLKPISKEDQQRNLDILLAKQKGESEAFQEEMRTFDEQFQLQLYGVDERKQLQEKQNEEKAHFEEQNKKLHIIHQQLHNKIPTFLTTEVAENLKPSDAPAIKGFIELLLTVPNVATNELLPILSTKLGTVTSLDLSQARYQIYDLSVEPAFFKILTEEKTLQTITSLDMFRCIGNSLIKLTNYKPFEDDAINLYLSKHEDFEPIFKKQMLAETVKKTVAKHEKWNPEFTKIGNEFILTLNDPDEKKLIDFMNLSANQNFNEELDKTLEILALDTTEFLEKMAAQPSEYQENWQELYKLIELSETKKRERTFLEQQKQANLPYETAFMRVVSEMKRRFDEAIRQEQEEARRSKPVPDSSHPPSTSSPYHEPTLKDRLIETAKKIWQPEYDGDKYRAKIREMSLEASEMLEEMANTPLSTEAATTS